MTFCTTRERGNIRAPFTARVPVAQPFRRGGRKGLGPSGATQWKDRAEWSKEEASEGYMEIRAFQQWLGFRYRKAS